MPRSSATLRNCSSVGLRTAMASLPVTTPAGWASSCNTDKLSDKACFAKIARRDFAHDHALLNDEDALRERGDEIEILFDQDHGEPAFGAQPQQGFDDLV